MCGRKHCFCCTKPGQSQITFVTTYTHSHLMSHLCANLPPTSVWCRKDRLCLPLVISVKQLSHLSTLTHSVSFLLVEELLNAPAELWSQQQAQTLHLLQNLPNWPIRVVCFNSKIYLDEFINSQCHVTFALVFTVIIGIKPSYMDQYGDLDFFQLVMYQATVV